LVLKENTEVELIHLLHGFLIDPQPILNAFYSIKTSRLRPLIRYFKYFIYHFQQTRVF